MSVVKLTTAQDHCAASVADVLADLLARAQSGDLIGFAGVIEIRGGYIETVSSQTMSRLQTAGALLEASMDVLRQE